MRGLDCHRPHKRRGVSLEGQVAWLNSSGVWMSLRIEQSTSLPALWIRLVLTRRIAAIATLMQISSQDCSGI